MTRTIVSIIPAIALAAVTLTAPAAKASLIFDATLSGASEVPPTGSPASGFAKLTVTGDSLEASVTFSGLTGPAAAAHIHCCTMPGTNVGVALPFVGFPAGTSGTYDQLFDLTNAATYTSTFLTASGGTAGAEANLLAGLEAGDAYVNIHTAAFPSGEIRGFDSPVRSVTEPASIALFGIGLAALGLLLRRRKSARLAGPLIASILSAAAPRLVFGTSMLALLWSGAPGCRALGRPAAAD